MALRSGALFAAEIDSAEHVLEDEEDLRDDVQHLRQDVGPSASAQEMDAAGEHAGAVDEVDEPAEARGVVASGREAADEEQQREDALNAEEDERDYREGLFRLRRFAAHSHEDGDDERDEEAGDEAGDGAVITAAHDRSAKYELDDDERDGYYREDERDVCSFLLHGVSLPFGLMAKV